MKKLSPVETTRARELGREPGEGDLPVEAGELVRAVVAQRAVERQLELVAHLGRGVVEEDAQRGVDLGAGERLDARQRLLRASSPCRAEPPQAATTTAAVRASRSSAERCHGMAQSGTGSGRATGPRTGPGRQVETVGPGAPGLARGTLQCREDPSFPFEPARPDRRRVHGHPAARRRDHRRADQLQRRRQDRAGEQRHGRPDRRRRQGRPAAAAAAPAAPAGPATRAAGQPGGRARPAGRVAPAARAVPAVRRSRRLGWARRLRRYRPRPRRREDVALCLGSAKEAGNCLLAARAPNTVSEKITERARDKVRQAQRDLYNSSARPGSPEYTRLVAARKSAIRDLVNSRRITDNFIVKPLVAGPQGRRPALPGLPQGLRPRVGGAQGHEDATRPSPLKPNTSSGGPVKPSPASKFLKGLGKVGKGLGVAGTALSLYDNVKNDGVAKGITKTAGGVAGAWGAGAAVTAGCVAIGVATAGVGGLACAGVALRRQLLRRQVRQPGRRLGLRPRRGRRRTSPTKRSSSRWPRPPRTPSRGWWTSAARRSTAGRR